MIFFDATQWKYAKAINRAAKTSQIIHNIIILLTRDSTEIILLKQMVSMYKLSFAHPYGEYTNGYGYKAEKGSFLQVLTITQIGL
jgi:hypothetical protein